MRSYSNHFQRPSVRRVFPLLALFGAALGGAEDRQAVASADFEDRTEGEPYVGAFWGTSDFPEPAWTQGFNEGRAFVDGSFPRGDSKKSIRVKYPERAVGPGEGGAQAPLRLEPRDEYYLSYWLRFGEDFSWGGEHHGGKLPGLAADELCSGGMGCDGTNGFTARLMWRDNGRGVLYLYHMDKPRKWGEDFQLTYPSGDDVVFMPGEWFLITERVKLNTDDNKDGLVQLWVDKKPVLRVENLRFVNNDDQIDTLFFSTFHGGNTPEWGPRRDSFINFDDFRVGPTLKSVW